MRTSATSFLSIRAAAYAFGVKQGAICRAIRLGTLRAVWRHGRLVIPAKSLAPLLGTGVPGVRRD